MSTYLEISIPTTCETWLTLQFELIDEVYNSGIIQGDNYNTHLAEAKLEQIFLELRFYLDYKYTRFKLKLSTHGSEQPNLEALTMAILLADLYFSSTVTPLLNKLCDAQNVLQVGYQINEGIVPLTVLTPPISKKPNALNNELQRTIQVIKSPEVLLGYHANCDHSIIEFIDSLLPAVTPTLTVAYYPIVDQRQLAKIKIWHKAIPIDPKFSIVGDFLKVRRSTLLLDKQCDFKSWLFGEFLILFEHANDKNGESWHLALMSAINMAAGLQPKLDKICIFTGQVSEGLCFSVNDIDLKLDIILHLQQHNAALMCATGKAIKGCDWQFYMSDLPPLKGESNTSNYHTLCRTNVSSISFIAVNGWQPSDMYLRN